MSSPVHASAVLTHDPLEAGSGSSLVSVSAGLRRAFSLGTDAAVETWAEVTGHRGACAWVQWQVRAVLYRHGFTGAVGDRYAVTVAGFVAREATRALEAEQDPRRAVLARIPRETFKASQLWPGLHPQVGRAQEWEQFLVAAEAFYARANAAAAAAVAVSHTATTPGPMDTGELHAETTRIAWWLWQTFTPEAIPTCGEHRNLAGLGACGGHPVVADPGALFTR